MTDLLPCPFCGEARISLNGPNEHDRYGSINCPACLVCLPGACSDREELVRCWNTRILDEPQREQDMAAALRLLMAEDERQSKLHELLETIREQIRTGVEPEHRPDGLFKNIQDAVYAMRGRTRLMDDAAITHIFDEPQGAPVTDERILATSQEIFPTNTVYALTWRVGARWARDELTVSLPRPDRQSTDR